jgi:dephospho-CoA kinase
VLLFSSSKLGHVSSSAAKELAKFQGLIHEYVPIHVKAAIEAKMGQYIIGVTGTIGSGKSSFCQMVSGVTHINMDTLSHELLESKLPIAAQTREKVKAKFGTCDRKELGRLVFGNEARLKELNAIFKEPMLTLLREKLVGKKGVIFLEGALLAEMNWLFLCNNRVILVKTPDTAEHTKRLKQRGHSDEEIARRIASQYDEAGKLEAITAQIDKDQFGKCLTFDTQNPNWYDATGHIYSFMRDLKDA